MREIKETTQDVFTLLSHPVHNGVQQEFCAQNDDYSMKLSKQSELTMVGLSA